MKKKEKGIKKMSECKRKKLTSQVFVGKKKRGGDSRYGDCVVKKQKKGVPLKDTRGKKDNHWRHERSKSH